MEEVYAEPQMVHLNQQMASRMSDVLPNLSVLTPRGTANCQGCYG